MTSADLANTSSLPTTCPSRSCTITTVRDSSPTGSRCEPPESATSGSTCAPPVVEREACPSQKEYSISSGTVPGTLALFTTWRVERLRAVATRSTKTSTATAAITSAVRPNSIATATNAVTQMATRKALRTSRLRTRQLVSMCRDRRRDLCRFRVDVGCRVLVRPLVVRPLIVFRPLAVVLVLVLPIRVLGGCGDEIRRRFRCAGGSLSGFAGRDPPPHPVEDPEEKGQKHQDGEREEPQRIDRGVRPEGLRRACVPDGALDRVASDRERVDRNRRANGAPSTRLDVTDWRWCHDAFGVAALAGREHQRGIVDWRRARVVNGEDQIARRRRSEPRLPVAAALELGVLDLQRALLEHGQWRCLPPHRF